MKITEYPEATTLTENDLILIDGENGTQKIPSANIANSLVDLMETNKVVSNLDLGSFQETSHISNTDSFLIAHPNVQNNIVLEKLNISSDTIFEILDNVAPLEMRRNIWRGRYLGTSLSSFYKNSINNGTFKGLFIGDYFKVAVGDTYYDFRIVDFDYWYGKGASTNLSKLQHHIVVMPDNNLFNISYNQIQLFNTDFVNTLYKIYMTPFYNAIKSVGFGAANILKIPTKLPVRWIDGAPVSTTWTYLDSIIPKEIMIFGTSINATSNDGRNRTVTSNDGNGTSSIFQGPTKYDTAEWSQLSAFKINPLLAIGNGIGSYWLDDYHTEGTHSVFDKAYGSLAYVDNDNTDIGTKPILALY